MRIKNMKKLLTLLTLAFAFAFQTAEAQTLTASVNRQNVPQGELVMLSLDYTGKQTHDKPDLSVLRKNFNIFSMAQEFQSIYENGKTSQLQRWNIGLMPRSAGTLSIPPISLGNISSQPLEIKVIPSGSSDTVSAENRDMPKYAIEAEADNLSPYVQQEVNMTVTLYDAGGLQGSAPYFDEAAQQDWNIIALGDPVLESKVINGRSVRVIKFKYALFPQKSGKLLLPSAKFEGFYLSGRNRVNPFQQLLDTPFGDIALNLSDMGATRNPVFLETKAREINVKPAAENSKWWIPAESLEIYSQWQPSPPVFKVGEAVSRNISIKALGVTDKQLPDLRFNSSGSIKQYPEKPVSENRIENGSVASVKNIKNVYIPSAPGKNVIPEIKIDWYNVKTGKFETAKLPAMEIMVLPGAAGVVSENEVASEQSAVLPKAAVSAGETDKASAETSHGNQPANLYLWLSAAFLAGVLITWMLLTALRNEKKQLSSSGNNYYNEVIRFAKHKDLRALRDSLILWARSKYQDERIFSFRDIYAYCPNAAFIQELEGLSALMYAPEKNEWDERKFIEAFVKANKFSQTPGDTQPPLPDLYQ